MFFHILDKAAVGIPERETLWNSYIRYEVNFTLAEVFPNRIILMITDTEHTLKMVFNQFYISFSIHTSHFWMDTMD